TKDQIFDAVWEGRIVSDSTLISRIKSARKAIGDSGQDQEMIKTLHGRGFRFMPSVTVVASPSRPTNGEGKQCPEPAFQPSLAVRPLKNLSPLPGSEPVAEGLTSELIRLLSRLRWLKIIASDFCPLLNPLAPGTQQNRRSFRSHYVLNGCIDRVD